jgi:nitrilase
VKATIAAVQAAPVYLDRDATIEKVAELTAEAAAAGARLVAFGEAFVPTYPDWVWKLKPGSGLADQLFARLSRQAVAVPSAATERLGAIAREHDVYLAVGVNECEPRRPGTLYNTYLYFGPDGHLLGKHRKLMPSSAERMVWGFGDGSTLLQVHDSPFGRIGGLLCWENYMPLARAAVYAEGVDLYLAPTWDRGENWLATLRHIAREGRCYVVGISIANRAGDVPEDIPGREELWPEDGWIHEGWSAILAPDGELLAGPAVETDTILVAEVDTELIAASRARFDVAGHYARPDVLTLSVNTKPMAPVTIDSA